MLRAKYYRGGRELDWVHSGRSRIPRLDEPRVGADYRRSWRHRAYFNAASVESRLSRLASHHGPGHGHTKPAEW